MDTLIRILQLLLALSIIVLAHELGHFLFARLFKIKVDKFYLFFDPWISLVKFKSKKSETEYGIGWLPLGGYCKISGMIDESMDKEALKEEPKPHEFRSRPAWQRFLVMFGGVLFNFILAILLHSAILFTWGESYLKNDDAVYGVQCNDLAQEIGFRNGDRILRLDGNTIDGFSELQVILVRERVKRVELLRDGEIIYLDIDPDYIGQMLNSAGMFMLRYPFQIAMIPDSSHNLHLGLMPGDRIVGIDSVEVFITQDIQQILQEKRGEVVTAAILREGSIIQKELKVDNEGKIGIILEAPSSEFFNMTIHRYSLPKSIPAGFNRTTSTIGDYVKDLKLIFSPKTEAYKSVGSLIAIGKIFPSAWSWIRFWNIIAWLSIMLAVLNLLPIPALDGGHILFILFEMVSGRKPSDKFMEYAQVTGMIILFCIMFLALGNDIVKLFK